MRQPYKKQMTIGSIGIREIEFDLNCRHEIIPILVGLQRIYTKPKLLDQILEMIKKDVLGQNKEDRGACGLDYWEILVLAAVRHGCNLDYDALHDLANNHETLRKTLGLGVMDKKRYSKSTLHENITKISPETIKKISDLLIKEGHTLFPKAIEKVRGDSFVVQTNIHHPTDANLILDGIRTMLCLVCRLAGILLIVGWRKHGYWWCRAKKLNRRIQRIASSKKENKNEKLKPLYQELIAIASDIIKRCKDTIAAAKKLKKADTVVNSLIDELAQCIEFTQKQCDLAHRRIILDEHIPHKDKVFSLFEPHTELINRGKMPYPIEFGHRVLVIQDRAGFILTYQIMDHTTDEKVVISVMKALQKRYGGRIISVSFDKGFWTPDNLKELEKIVQVACLPKKGRRSQKDSEREGAPDFGKARKWHSGIESAIHALGSGNGLVLCRDKKEEGYKRYVALGILGRNLQVLGTLLLKKIKKRQKRQAKAA